MHIHCSKILSYLSNKDKEVDLEEVQRSTGLGKDEVLWAIETLKGDKAVSYKKKATHFMGLTKEGLSYVDSFPEERLVRDIASERISGAAGIKDRIGLVWAKKNGWLDIKDGKLVLTYEGREIVKRREYPLRKVLSEIVDGKYPENRTFLNKDDIKTLKSRKLIDIKSSASLYGIRITESGRKLLDWVGSQTPRIKNLSREVILNKSWKTKGFEEYDVGAPAETVFPARAHPMHEFINEVRDTWLDMGFEECTGPIVNPSFWNFDVLFTPQDHPARDKHDTFFLSNPRFIEVEEADMIPKIKAMHESGWGSKWDESIARRALLNTHNTVLSARYIRDFARTHSDRTAKAFFVGRVFRNESLDYKHLADFYQSDGIIIGDDLTLSNLIYELKEFYHRLVGTHIKILMRPSYFPFTEPSLEVFYFDSRHKEYVELAGAGIIRKEITDVLGTKKRVIAWGMGLERLLLDRLGIDDVGKVYKNRMAWLRTRKEL